MKGKLRKIMAVACMLAFANICLLVPVWLSSQNLALQTRLEDMSVQIASVQKDLSELGSEQVSCQTPEAIIKALAESQIRLKALTIADIGYLG
ncbi:MAG: hypothetical protein PHI83_00290 [Sphaerochaetaceae bacterium]|jgi:hypothetical protein|nr:hypothetical protein [Sphaerochaetaceae bacterium]